MSTNKNEAPKSAPTKEVSAEDQIKSLQAQLEEANKAKAKAEEQAVEAICKKLGMTPAQLEESEKQNKKNAETMEYDIGRIVVSINGNSYTGRGQARADVVECIMSMAGNKRMRELRAKIGNNHEIYLLAGGGFGSRKIGQSEDSLV